MDICLRQSKLCAQMKYLRFVGRIFRRLVYETAMDTTTGLAAQMAYQFLFTLAPGLLFLWHLLGLFGTDPAKLHQMLEILKSFLPSDPKVQEILDTQAASVVVMSVRIDDVLNGLGRDRLAHQFVDRLGTRIARRAFEHHDVVGKFNREAARTRAVQRPQAVAHLVDGDRRRRRRFRSREHRR